MTIAAHRKVIVLLGPAVPALVAGGSVAFLLSPNGQPQLVSTVSGD